MKVYFYFPAGGYKPGDAFCLIHGPVFNPYVFLVDTVDDKGHVTNNPHLLHPDEASREALGKHWVEFTGGKAGPFEIDLKERKP